MSSITPPPTSPSPASNPLSPLSALPPSLLYTPSFLASSLQTPLLSSLPPNRWKELNHRRLQSIPTELSANNTLISASLPPYLSSIANCIVETGVFTHTKHQRPNHVLVNEYRPGEGIMAHEDGAAYEPVVATISLGGSICLDLYEKAEGGGKGRLVGRILQEPGSLLVTSGRCYTEFLHGISEVTVDEGLNEGTVLNWGLLKEETRAKVVENGGNLRREETRVSLTFRDVTKVVRVGGIFGKK